MDHPRRDYESGELNEDLLDPDPLVVFSDWLAVARNDERIDEAVAMTLATANRLARPSARVVLMREFDERGIVFFTNYESHKGNDIAANPFAAAVFYWGPLERQVRIEGSVERLDPTDSDTYFASRPYRSRIGALASRQSKPVGGRHELEARFDAAAAAHPEPGPVPRPPSWGGYRLVPSVFEFWQGRRSRLHDRIVYEMTANGWKTLRLEP